MNCSYCGKPVDESFAVVFNGIYFCNNLCKYSFNINKINKAEIGSQKNINKIKNKTPGLQTYVNKRDKLADFESFSNNKYIKIVSAILIALIGFFIYKGIENYFENKQLFRFLWICIFSLGFIVTAAAKKHNKTPGEQTSVDNRRDNISNSKSFFDNNYLKLVLAI